MIDAQPVLGVAGDTLNTAIYIKRTKPDFDVGFVTRVGKDPFSDQIVSFIAEQHVETRGIERSGERVPGLYAITTREDGERSFTYWRNDSAARTMFQGETGADFTALKDYDVLYLSGITLAILPKQVRHALFDYLKATSQKLAFDSNYRPKLWDSQDTAQRWVTAFWGIADYALPSIDDEMALFGETAAQVRDRFAQSGLVGALKQGAEGPLSLGEPVSQIYQPAKKVVDTTAAGDSFNGAYLAAKLAGKTQADALMQGHHCAAYVVQHRGAIAPVPS
jgi:2-dehydro-3-deoxygluconokinase